MPDANLKVTSRGRWQPKPRAKPAPPPLLVDLKDDHAPATPGRLRPYLLSGAAILPLLAGLWIWLGVPTEPEPALSPGSTDRPANVGLPTVRSAHVIEDAQGGGLSVEADVISPGGGTVGTRFQWHVNGQVLPGQTASTLPAGMVRHGDQITVDVIPNNGTIDGIPYRTPAFMVGNALPVVLKIEVEPRTPRVGEAVSVAAEVTDTDRDTVSLSYRWFRNGTLIQEGPSHIYNAEELVRGDRLAVEVIPHDGRSEGRALRSENVIIGNGRPRITSTPSFSLEGASLRYQLTAVDPDHDPLTFSLAAAPSGMTIDRAKGQVVWTPAPEAKGPQRVRIEVRDDQGGIDSQEFDVTVPSPTLVSAPGT